MLTIKRFAVSCALLLAACGGGGGGGSTPPPPAPSNRAPSITSAAAISVAENITGTVYTLTASDPDGDALTFSVIAGGDESDFNINTTTGVITTAAPLDFEAPADANRDNVYEVALQARDPGGLVARVDLRITVTNVTETMALKRVGSGFAQPVYLEGIPGTSRVVVVQKGGRIRVLDPATSAIESVDFLNLTGQVSTGGEQGLLGLAFSPAFATDRTVYVALTNPAGNYEIRRYRMFSGSSTQADPATADLIFTVPRPAANHNAGWIGFSNDGLLYVPLGDSGGGGDPLEVAQDINALLGKILRIDVRTDAFPADDNRDYAIPPGNPFASSAGADEIFAIGVRNPFRCSFDPQTGDLFIGDVGQNAREEVNRLRPSDAGANFGWDEREGTITFEGPSQPGFTNPVAEYAHGSGPDQGRSITGGYVYRGPVEPIRNHYVFADFVSGNIWSVPVANLVIGQTVPASGFTRLNPTLVPDAGTLANISSFGLDTSGRLYIVAFGGDVFRIETAP